MHFYRITPWPNVLQTHHRVTLHDPNFWPGSLTVTLLSLRFLPASRSSTEKVNTWCAENADVPGACWVDVSVFTRKTSECSDLFMSTVFAPPVMGTCLVNSEHNTVLLFFVQLVAVDKMICSPLHAPKPPTILHSSEDTRRVRSNHFQKLRKHICQESQRGGV